MAGAVSLHSLPLFVRMAGRPVILLGDGPAADAKQRLLERAGAVLVEEQEDARFAIVAIADDEDAAAAVARLKARGILVNAVDRPALCDFTLPAIVDRDPVLVAIGTGGASAGLAAALRQRLETLLPDRLGALASGLHAARDAIRQSYPDSENRRRSLGEAMTAGGALDPLDQGVSDRIECWLRSPASPQDTRLISISLRSADPDDLTLREAQLLGQADRIYARAEIPAAILDRARADVERVICDATPADPGPGLSIDLEMAR